MVHVARNPGDNFRVQGNASTIRRTASSFSSRDVKQMVGDAGTFTVDCAGADELFPRSRRQAGHR